MGLLKDIFGSKENKIQVVAPVAGKLVPLSEVSDPTFSEEILGQGAAVIPSENEFLSPVDGTVTTVFPTGHAVALTSVEGVEILLHIGLDTVSLGGEGFKVLVKQGKKVKQGDALLEFDKALVERKGLATDCILSVTNSDDLPGMKLVSGIDAVQNETVVCTF